MRLPVRRSEDGMVTAEAAAVLPSLVVVLVLAMTVVLAVGAKMKLVDAAREAARIAARGDSVADATRAAQRLGPVGTHVHVSEAGGVVTVEVHAEVRPFGLLPGIPLDARAVTELEQQP